MNTTTDFTPMNKALLDLGYTNEHTCCKSHGDGRDEIYQAPQTAQIIVLHCDREGRVTSIRESPPQDYRLAREIRADERQRRGGHRRYAFLGSTTSPCATAEWSNFFDALYGHLYRLHSVAGHGEYAERVTDSRLAEVGVPVSDHREAELTEFRRAQCALVPAYESRGQLVRHLHNEWFVVRWEVVKGAGTTECVFRVMQKDRDFIEVPRRQPPSIMHLPPPPEGEQRWRGRCGSTILAVSKDGNIWLGWRWSESRNKWLDLGRSEEALAAWVLALEEELRARKNLGL